MPIFITILLAKLILKASRMLGRGGGSALPGLIAEKIDPTIGSKIAKSLSYGTILVTGTNGKTTTTKMLAKAMSDAGFEIVVNRAGSNLSRGVVSTLIEKSNLSGKIRARVGIFEVDEAALPGVARLLKPKAIIILNLFRDQLDRYGELDSIAKLLGGAIAESKSDVYLNSDDPLVTSLADYAKGNQVYFFGVDDAPVVKLKHDVTADSAHCPKCGNALEYPKNFYGHIGLYFCPNGDFSRPEPNFAATDVGLTDNSATFIVETQKNIHQPTRLNLPGIYNVYNAVAAFAVANNFGMDSHRISSSLELVEPAFGRVEEIEIDGKTIYLLLIKNPTGFNQIIQTFLMGRKNQNVLIQINDNIADGRDVSWLWDVAFEELLGLDHKYMAGGIRATDLALRFKYTGLPISVNSGIENSLKEFLKGLPKGEVGYIIPTYTAMLETRNLLGQKTKLSGAGDE